MNRIKFNKMKICNGSFYWFADFYERKSQVLHLFILVIHSRKLLIEKRQSKIVNWLLFFWQISSIQKANV